MLNRYSLEQSCFCCSLIRHSWIPISPSAMIGNKEKKTSCPPSEKKSVKQRITLMIIGKWKSTKLINTTISKWPHGALLAPTDIHTRIHTPVCTLYIDEKRPSQLHMQMKRLFLDIYKCVKRGVLVRRYLWWFDLKHLSGYVHRRIRSDKNVRLTKQRSLLTDSGKS